jgi:hypothetical protein
LPRLPVVSGTEVVRALKRAGFVVDRQRGSHVTLWHPGQRRDRGSEPYGFLTQFLIPPVASQPFNRDSPDRRQRASRTRKLLRVLLPLRGPSEGPPLTFRALGNSLRHAGSVTLSRSRGQAR